MLERCVIWFFFSSRRRHTRFDCDWSSDVCSSDLVPMRGNRYQNEGRLASWPRSKLLFACESRFLPLSTHGYASAPAKLLRSEERRVGKECRSRWSPYH